MTGDDLAEAALRLVGTPFRLHGRSALAGLDCIGVLEAALKAAGRPARLPNGYALRTRKAPDTSSIIAGLGLDPAAGTLLPGDVLLLRPSPCQLHLAIAAAHDAVVHAHAGLRRVVLGPLPGWARIGHWRLSSNPEH